MAAEAALALREVADRGGDARRLVITRADGQAVEVPPRALDLLLGALDAVSRGDAVTVAATRPWITIREAAALLEGSGFEVAKLLDAGAIPSSGRGRRRMMRLVDVFEYRDRRSDAG